MKAEPPARADRRRCSTAGCARGIRRRSMRRTCSTRRISTYAVARGAAYYGRARAADAAFASGAAPRAATTSASRARCRPCPGFPAPLKALCVVPFGMEEGTSAPIAGREFGLSVGEPAEFRFLTSTIRKDDPPGTIIEDWGDDLEELGPLEVTLDADAEPGPLDRRWGRPVTLESRVTEIGHARAVVQRERRRASLEAGAEHPRGAIRVKCLRTPFLIGDRSRHHQLRGRRRGHAEAQSAGSRCSAFRS